MFDVHWPTKPIVAGKDKPDETACLMHHKFVLIDAEPRISSSSSSAGDGGGDSDSDSEEEESENEEKKKVCPKCGGGGGGVGGASASESAISAVPCYECRPVRIRSKRDLVLFPSNHLPRLPKNGVLITGSHNWSTQVSYLTYVASEEPRN